MLCVGRLREILRIGWLKIGHKADVPRQATFVGRFDDIYVWVMPEGVHGLSELSLAIMDIATTEDDASLAAAGEHSVRSKSGPSSVPRRNFQVPPVGPVFHSRSSLTRLGVNSIPVAYARLLLVLEIEQFGTNDKASGSRLDDSRNRPLAGWSCQVATRDRRDEVTPRLSGASPVQKQAIGGGQPRRGGSVDRQDNVVTEVQHAGQVSG